MAMAHIKSSNLATESLPIFVVQKLALRVLTGPMCLCRANGVDRVEIIMS